MSQLCRSAESDPQYEICVKGHLAPHVITLLFEINNGTTDIDDSFHLIFKIVALLFIIWSAWRWRIPGYPTSQEA